jgi:2-methylcitrate dehydratase
MSNEMGYPSALSAKTWGFYDVLFKGQAFKIEREFSAYVMENILFKISYPAEFHAQTAVEAALQLHPKIKDRLNDIQSIVIDTQEAGMRIIDKTGPLDNPADRDHCIQYMAAIPLLFGRLTAADYEDDIAANPIIDELRAKMKVREKKSFTADYFNPNKRYIGNAIQIFFKDGSKTECVSIDFPIGHRERRQEGIPVLKKKFQSSIQHKLRDKQWTTLNEVFIDKERFEKMPVDEFMSLLVV